MAESLHCSSETTTALLIGYTPIQNKKFKVLKKKTNQPKAPFPAFPKPHIRQVFQSPALSYSQPRLPLSVVGGALVCGGGEEVAPWSDRHSQDLTQYPPPHQTTAAAKSLQSSPTLCDPIEDSPTGSALPGILQARTLEWAASSFSIYSSN